MTGERRRERSTERSRRRLAVLGTGVMCVIAGCATGCATVERNSVTGSMAPISVQSDVVYAHRDAQDLRADIYSPAGQGPFPAVLVVHGGSWRRGNKRLMASVAERLARRGYVAVSIDYRLAPAYRFPTQLYDCQDAARWMRANASTLHIDPHRLGGFGYSAGAHLVALLATTDAASGWDDTNYTTAEDTRLQAAVLGAAPIDLRRFKANRIFRNFLGGNASELPELYAAASPITFVTPDDPPMFVYQGASDWLVDPSQSRLMVDALDRAGVPVQYYETTGGHFTTFLFDSESVRRAIDFLDCWLRPGEAAASITAAMPQAMPALPGAL